MINEIQLLYALQEQIYMPRAYVKLTGSHSAAYLLAQIIHWHSKMGGEFYRTVSDWEEDGFTKETLRTATRKIKKYVSVEIKGIPPRNHYTLNIEALVKDLQYYTTDNQREGNPPNVGREIHPSSLQENTGNISARAENSLQEEKTTTEVELDPSGVPLDAEQPKQKTSRGRRMKKLIEMVELARGAPFPTKGKQMSSIKRMVDAGIQHHTIGIRWERMKKDDYWVDKELIPDFTDVENSFNRRPPQKNEL